MKKKIIIAVSILLAIAIVIGAVCYFFPLRASFSHLVGIKPDEVAKIVVRDGNTGEARETGDPKQIQALFDGMKEMKFTRDFSHPRDGWSYAVDIYPKNHSGFVKYTVSHGINSYDGFRGAKNGNYTESDRDRALEILSNIFESLA